MFDKKKLYSRVDAEKWAHPEQRKENFEIVRKTTEEYTSTLVQGLDSVYAGGDTTGYGYRYGVILEGNIADCWKYDLTRSWIKDL